MRASYQEAPSIVATSGVERLLRLSHYIPLERFIGRRDQPFGWETLRVIGASQAALDEAYPSFERRGRAGGQLRLPPTEWARGHTSAFIRFRGGRARQIAVEIDTRLHPGGRQRIFDLLTAKYGAPKGRPPARDERRWVLREGDVPVLLSERDQRVKIIVGRL